MITSYYYKGPENDPWEFDEISLNKINLFVGTSGAGKTKYLNTIFNFSGFVVRGNPFMEGSWKLTIETEKYEYYWEYESRINSSGKNEITHELVKRRLLNSQDDFKSLVSRSIDLFTFCDTKLPKLQLDTPSITLLKEEEYIRPLYDTFSLVQRRNFHDEGLRDALALQNVPADLIKNSKSNSGINELWKQENTLNAKIFLLKENFPELYNTTINTFKQIFNLITDCNIQILKNPPISIHYEGIVPVFVIKEKKVKKWIPLQQLSSGMQKVLLIIADILTLPKGSIYIIDEYENSLGINAIDFLPQFLLEHGQDIQIFVTTHHPYLINSMPMKSWRVFHRTGSKVTIKNGKELENSYGKSKQKAFIQLINDPFYMGD